MILYTFEGINLTTHEAFTVTRRYKQFHALHTFLRERYPGMYVPPIPKKALSNKNEEFVEERCFLLNKFVKQLTKCPYLLESQEFNVFCFPN